MNEDQDKGRKILSAVERILEDTDAIITRVERLREGASGEGESLEAVAAELIRHYSNRSAISGGATAIPALLPGVGTLAAVLGGTAVDIALVLKFEVEMALSLSWLHGHDIRSERERQLAFLLASVSTHDAKTGRNFFVDLAEVEAEAVWNYAPREISKLVVSVFAKLALLWVGKGAARAIPLVGIAVGSGLNKALTLRVGRQIHATLQQRAALGSPGDEDIVDAAVDDAAEEE